MGGVTTPTCSNTSKAEPAANSQISRSDPIAGAIAGGVTTNPIVLGIILDSGFILKTYYEIKDSKKKIELYQIPFSTYVKTLIELGFFLRGVSFDKELVGPTENCRSYHHRLVFNV